MGVFKSKSKNLYFLSYTSRILSLRLALLWSGVALRDIMQLFGSFIARGIITVLDSNPQCGGWSLLSVELLRVGTAGISLRSLCLSHVRSDYCWCKLT